MKKTINHKRMDRNTVLAGERHLRRVDPIMKRVIQQHEPCTIAVGRTDYFDTLAWSIVSQQLSTKAAHTIGQRLIEKSGESRMKAAAIHVLTHDQLRSVGLSNNKARFLWALADDVLEGKLNFRSLAQLPDELVKQRLIELKGVGQWTAEMFLMFALRRPDVASPDDVGLQRAMYELYNLRKRPSHRRFYEIARPWSPFRTIACWYLWRAVD